MKHKNITLLVVVTAVIATALLVYSGTFRSQKNSNKVGTFQMGDVTLKVPREYIWYDRYEPSGPVDALNLMFRFPSMESGNANGDQSNNVNILLGWIHRKPEVDLIPETDRIQNWYEIKLGAQIANRVITWDKPEYHEDLGLNSFTVTQYMSSGKIGNKFEIFYIGDPKHPDYWLRCAVKYKSHMRPRCEGRMELFNHFTIKYGFNREHLLIYHRQIREKVQNAIGEFVAQ